MKLPSHAWLFFLLPLSGIAFAAPEPLLKVVVASTSANDTSNSCTLDGNGKVIIEHTVKLSPSGSSLKSKEVRAANLSVNDIKSVIANAAQGNITGKPLVGSYTHQYFAYQQQNSQTKKIFLLDKVGGGVVNDSPAVGPLTKFIDSVCGDLSFVPYQDTAKAKFAKVILDTASIKAAVEVCGQTNAGLGTCDGTPSDYGVYTALIQANQKIAATPPSEATTASVNITQFDPFQTTITATAVTNNGLNGEIYILNGVYYYTGFIIWNVDPNSTCLVAGIC